MCELLLRLAREVTVLLTNILSLLVFSILTLVVVELFVKNYHHYS